jgi:hypothetical protein
VVDGVLPVGGFDGSAVSRAPLDTQDCFHGGRGRVEAPVTAEGRALVPASALLIVESRLDAVGYINAAGLVGQVRPIDTHASPT